MAKSQALATKYPDSEEIIHDGEATDKANMYYREFTYEEPMRPELYIWDMMEIH